MYVSKGGGKDTEDPRPGVPLGGRTGDGVWRRGRLCTEGGARGTRRLGPRRAWEWVGWDMDAPSRARPPVPTSPLPGRAGAWGSALGLGPSACPARRRSPAPRAPAAPAPAAAVRVGGGGSGARAAPRSRAGPALSSPATLRPRRRLTGSGPTVAEAAGAFGAGINF